MPVHITEIIGKGELFLVSFFLLASFVILIWLILRKEKRGRQFLKEERNFFESYFFRVFFWKSITEVSQRLKIQFNLIHTQSEEVQSVLKFQ